MICAINIYLQHNGRKVTETYIVIAYHRLDAVLKWARYAFPKEVYEEGILENDDSICAYGEALLAEYEVTEISRAMALEYVERRLDGDDEITIWL